MKILLLHQYFLEEDDFGGSRFNEITEQWTADGSSVSVIAGMVHANGIAKRPEYKGKFIKVNYQRGIKVIRSHVSESYNSGFLGRLWGYFSFMLSSLYAGLFIDKGKYDVILVTSPPLFVGISGLLISKIRRIPMVFEIRDLWPESAIDTGVLTNKIVIKFALWIEKIIYRNSNKINVLTPAFRIKLIENKNVDPSKIFYIPNACDFKISEKVLAENNRDLLRESFGWSDKFVITYVGAHGVANHLDQIIEAASHIKNKRIVINLIGDGMQKQYLKRMAQDLNCQNVFFIDPVAKEEVFKYILASDIGTSILKKVDTFKTIYSNKTFDYMSCKTPVLVLIDGISRNLIEEAKCGFYAEPENINQIVNTIENLANISREDLINFGLNGYNYATENFDRIKLSKKYLNEINNVINE
jgi:glycosyltransferase involved in cell wall biosynthesis